MVKFLLSLSWQPRLAVNDVVELCSAIGWRTESIFPPAPKLVRSRRKALRLAKHRLKRLRNYEENVFRENAGPGRVW